MELVSITCPTCFENFEILSPPPSELPTEIDYDCEICCSPMMIEFLQVDQRIESLSRSLSE
ncbi:MAG: hypothetical protein CMO46_08335 [Verrucomicrobiales bacterium]|nr:hypothetical protein [Verrucomicrobiales bacterium]